MPLRLRAPGRTLPLAFSETAQHLDGEKAAYRAEGKALAGEALDDQLELEGIGAKTVRFGGFYRAPGAKVSAPLSRWEVETQVVGSLDSQSLARLAHAAARRFAGQYSKGESPQEIYLTAIDVGDTPRDRKPRPAPKPRKRVVYRDRETGHYVPRETYMKSKRARAAARRAGKRVAHMGRYARVVEWVTL